MRIDRAPGLEDVLAASDLFDQAPRLEATARFLADPGHHLLLAYDDAGRPVGMVTGVELTHPDKGTEMFLYELEVAAASRRQGIGTALVRELAGIAMARGCYGMWVGVEPGNEPAQATYRSAGATEPSPCVLQGWEFPVPGG